jgi:exodeoxyribonuclease V beta subunit
LRGIRGGTLMHEALEIVDPARVASAPDASAAMADPLIRGPLEALVARSGLADSSGRAALVTLVGEFVWRGLALPFLEGGGSVGTLPPADRRAEIEFHRAIAGGFRTGVIDLVLRRNGKWYLLDWKSNRLPAYDPASLAAEMKRRDYHLQWRLYLHALTAWLRRVVPGFDPAAAIGGVYYIFLRGLSTSDAKSGVYFHRPEPGDLEVEP